MIGLRLEKGLIVRRACNGQRTGSRPGTQQRANSRERRPQNTEARPEETQADCEPPENETSQGAPRDEPWERQLVERALEESGLDGQRRAETLALDELVALHEARIRVADRGPEA